MEYLNVKPEGRDLRGKPRVYFTCHPDDFGRSFEKICEDIFKTHECAIYYTEDMTIAEPVKENIDTDLGSMNLFVIPISFKLLSTESRTMSLDYPYAIEHHIPVLPIMLESGLDALYSRKDKFGERQYLNPYSHDITEISYEEKLKKYLKSVLIDDKTAERVRAEFDAYIFLSYRKKDRKYANELMRIIHSKPIYRDIAIWYDEFLTPGENFNDMIGKVLDKSDLFAMLVTPNLVNEENYVKSVEYPAACQAGKSILPAEMQKTDREELKKQFVDIPECVNVYNDDEFRNRLLVSLSNIAIKDNDNDPGHNFLIGLAYLDGIDVEVDREQALELITSAANTELPEAMEKLAKMYHEGSGVALDWREELKWRQRIVDHFIVECGEEHSYTLSALNNLAVTYNSLGDYKNTLELSEKCYELQCKVLGEEHPDTLTTLNSLAATYVDLGDHKKALELNEKCYELCCKVLGEEHIDTLHAMNNLSVIYAYWGNHRKALELKDKCYVLLCELLGEEHMYTLYTLNNLSVTYADLGNHRKSLELEEKCYELRCKVFGEDHPDTLIALNNLAVAYGKLGDHRKELELNEKCYELICEVLGEKHPNTLKALCNLATSYICMRKFEKGLKCGEKAYILMCETFGEEHPDTLTAQNNLVPVYIFWGYRGKALELAEKSYDFHCKTLGEKHPNTMNSLNWLLSVYRSLNKSKKSLEICDRFLQSDWNLTEDIIEDIANIYKKNGFLEKAAAIRARLS